MHSWDIDPLMQLDNIPTERKLATKRHIPPVADDITPLVSPGVSYRVNSNDLTFSGRHGENFTEHEVWLIISEQADQLTEYLMILCIIIIL